MDPNEILQTSMQIAKAGAAFGAAVPFTALVRRMLGPAADEIAERVRDEVRLYRYGRQLSLLKKAETMAHAAGFTPKAVPIKLLFSLLEGASLEENEDIHDMWAALLANASNPSDKVAVRPSFTETLKLLTPEVARFLDVVYMRANLHTVYSTEGWPKEHGGEWLETQAKPMTVFGLTPRELRLVELGTYSKLYTLFCEAGCTGLPVESVVTSASSAGEIERDEVDRQQFEVVMNELARFEMWSVRPSRSSGDHFYFSAYAVQFLVACHAPGGVSAAE